MEIMLGSYEVSLLPIHIETHLAYLRTLYFITNQTQSFTAPSVLTIVYVFLFKLDIWQSNNEESQSKKWDFDR